MYFQDYLWFMVAILVCMIFSGYASSKVNRAYSKHGAVFNRSGMSGYDAAARLLRANGVNDITIGRVKGHLSDHYHPAKGVVNLSDSTYDSRSVASVAVAAQNSDIGYYIAMLGVILYGGSLLFALVTLPVELNASRRAKKMLASEGILYGDELKGADEVLSAAAMTYLASLLTSLVYFLKFLVRVLTMFGRRDNRR